MHNQNEWNMDTMNQILAYLKFFIGKGILFSKHGSLDITVTLTLTLQVLRWRENLLQDILHFLEVTWWLEKIKNKM